MVGLIDWDLASPARPIMDLAFATWSFGPIHRPDHARALGAPLDVVPRIRLLCESYGLGDRRGLLSAVRLRTLASIVAIEAKAGAGEEAFCRLISEGHVARMRDDLGELGAHLSKWQAGLEDAEHEEP